MSTNHETVIGGATEQTLFHWTHMVCLCHKKDTQYSKLLGYDFDLWVYSVCQFKNFGFCIVSNIEFYFETQKNFSTMGGGSSLVEVTEHVNKRNRH